jgi:hypothetical protein
MAGSRPGGAAAAVVANLDPQLVRRMDDLDVGSCGVRMLEHVRQALLDNPVGGEVQRPRERCGLTLGLEVDPQSRPAYLVEQQFERCETRLRSEVDVVRLVAHGAEEPAHLGERGPPGSLDVLERLLVVGQLVGEPVPDGSHLEHHHAHRVRDDVVQFARDPRALLGDRDPRRRLALALGARRASLGSLGLPGAGAERKPERPGDREQHRQRDVLACGARRVVGGDDGRGCHHDDEADARLEGVAEVAEEKCCGHA